MIKLDNIQMAFGHVSLLDGISLSLEKGERVGLIGRNGEGKSTLLKIIDGSLKADDGQIEIQQGHKVARLEQEPVFAAGDTIFQAVASALGEAGRLLAEYLSVDHADETQHDQIADLQQRLEQFDAWGLQPQVEQILSRLELPAETQVSTLSGGWQRRVALAQALVQKPDCLLLDEPTNHLDIELIEWLENQLQNFKGSLLFISHDRRFVHNLATRIIELDRGVLRSYPGDFATYLSRKAAELEAEATQAAKFDKKLAQEEVWIRQGIKARRTRNEGRVRALQKLRQQRSQRREQVGKIKLNLEQGDNSGKLVIEAENIGQSYDDKVLFQQFSTLILRGDRVGLIGGNGVGKSTLLKILLQQLEPETGSIRHGTRLQIAYYDQLRSQLDPEQHVYDVVSQGKDHIEINGKSKHVMSYLADFLFAPERARSPVKALSGGERNRLLLARLFSKPANLLVMDEPTNDLDVESLELLEELLINYQGTLLLVSHDRAFIDNVIGSTIVFDGKGGLAEYVGGYQDYLRQAPKADAPSKEKPAAKTNTATASKPVSVKKATKKLSYKEKQELANLPAVIENTEAELETLQETISDTDFYQQDSDAVNKVLKQVADAEAKLEAAYARWDELEG